MAPQSWVMNQLLPLFGDGFHAQKLRNSEVLKDMQSNLPKKPVRLSPEYQGQSVRAEERL
jgi:hypothetical protein